ncbi:lariat debranching enzyme [Pilobolus umbonatus]|nr:lariat debranching enzyme [Pilobolus umbonatus]
MKIAVQGCCHGELDNIYGSLKLIEQNNGCKIDLLIICGDFQAIRNETDLNSLSVPDKFKTLGSFWKYYSGKEVAPYLTLFIGGNHEASNYLWELYHGGWICDNIYYMGHSGVINFGGLRIGGISGIYKSGDYWRGYMEQYPYNPRTLKSAYHVRKYEVDKLMQIQQPLDIFLSHDWPRGIERYGNLDLLMYQKKFFRQEIMTNTLGCEHNEILLSKLKPSYWFAAHLHVHFPALVNHDMWDKKIYPPRTREILGIEDQPPNDNSVPAETTESTSDTPSKPSEVSDPPKFTKFLSLDKCLPRRKFIQIIDIPEKTDENPDFYYDMEWLSITRAMHPYLSLSNNPQTLPDESTLEKLIKNERFYLEDKLKSGNLDLKIPHNFERTAPPYPRPDTIPDIAYVNPQTTTFCDMIDIQNKINTVPESPKRAKIEHIEAEQAVQSEIIIDDDEFL